ncbi:MAG: CDP-alcohol phosphatidyltransferase family protein [Candidatus Thorarchaeota archaeon]|nr:CDP-alcohol phosphatidyltransferase family protein [Candidatus Thorarchaeota archaeon]
MSPSRFRLRKIFRRPVQVAAKPFIKMNVHPNTITYLSLLVAFGAFLTLVLTQNQLVFGILVFIVGFLDGVDGAVARATGKSSPKGAFTDSLIDKVAEAILIVAIPIAYPGQTLLGLDLSSWAYFCFAGWLLTSYSRARAESVGVADLDIGIGARSERLFTMFLLSLVFMIVPGLALLAFLGLGTAVYRIVNYRGQIISHKEEPTLE